MTYRYVPKLRWMRGERVGVQKLSQPARYDVVPLFVLAPKQYVGRDATKHKPTIPAANRVSQEILSIWGTAPIYLDASYLPEPADGPHPITRIARRARSDSLTLIPATRLNAPANYQQAVNSMAQRDERGVALRVDLQGMTSAASWIGDWPHPQSETDLIVDFADDAARAFALGDSLKHAFLNLHGAGDWRSVTTIGSNMPDSFSGYAAGLHLIDRAEWKLWQHLIGAGLPYRLDYGDYATVPTNPPPAGIRWGFPINVRYTLEQEFLICRGVGTRGYAGVEMDVQLTGHAAAIAAYPGRMPLTNSWGDTRIDLIAAQTNGPQGLEHWVQIGVNRHIELTRDRLP